MIVTPGEVLVNEERGENHAAEGLGMDQKFWRIFFSPVTLGTISAVNIVAVPRMRFCAISIGCLAQCPYKIPSSFEKIVFPRMVVVISSSFLLGPVLEPP